MHMAGWTRGSLFAALSAAGLAVLLVLSAGTAQADPDPVPGDPGVAAPPAPPPPPPFPFPGVPPPDPLGLPVMGSADGQDPTPFTGPAPFGTPSFVPKTGSMVGVGQPIIINFPGRVDDSGAAQAAVHVS